LVPALHIGQRVKAVWKRSGLTGTAFASRLHRQRQSIYHLFGQASIDTALLLKISEVLQHDFFQEYSKLIAEKASTKTTTPLEKLSESIDRLTKEIKQMTPHNCDRRA